MLQHDDIVLGRVDDTLVPVVAPLVDGVGGEPVGRGGEARGKDGGRHHDHGGGEQARMRVERSQRTGTQIKKSKEISDCLLNIFSQNLRKLSYSVIRRKSSCCRFVLQEVAAIDTDFSANSPAPNPNPGHL